MDLRAVIKDLESCPCGRKHHFDLETYEADRGLVHKVGEILTKGNFPKNIYIVSDEEALKTARDLARLEGLMCGISSGTNVAAAIAMAKKLGPGKTVVTILPDTAERYFSTPLFDE